jgi:Protein of unknown function (DUF1761)
MMINAISALNWFSVLLAFAVYFLLAILWYTVLFKKQYSISLGKENEPQQSLTPIFIVGPAICTLIVTLTSAILMNALNIESYQDALVFAIIVGFGYLVANTVDIAINPNIPRPLLYGAISGSYHLVGILMVSMILVSMR